MDPQELECEKLLLKGDPGAIKMMLARYQRPLFSFLYHRVGDRMVAEDLLQEVFVKVWRGRSSYRRPGALAGWLFTIARNAAVDHMAKARLRRHGVLDDSAPEPGGPEREVESAMSRERIDAAIQALPENQREVFLMREYGGLSFAAIAKALGCPLGTALGRMRYAVLKLRKELGDLDARS